tara:strand:+ start:1111 stop:1845 length:735 start_codon:yes stop_codon:yes gene_type:complete
MPTLPNTRIVQIVSNTNPTVFRSGDIDLGQVSRVHLKTLIIPNTEYNVNSKTDAVVIDGVSVVVPQGQYNIDAYLTALKTQLDIASAPNTFTVAQNPNTFRLVFTKSGGAEFTIMKSPASRLIGQHSTKTSVGLTLTTDGIPDLSGMRLVVFQSYTLGKFKISSLAGSTDTVKTVVLGGEPMSVPFGQVLKSESTEETLDSHYFNGYHNCSNFDMLLTDENGDALELNGSEFIISFEMHVKGST